VLGAVVFRQFVRQEPALDVGILHGPAGIAGEHSINLAAIAYTRLILLQLLLVAGLRLVKQGVLSVLDYLIVLALIDRL